MTTPRPHLLSAVTHVPISFQRMCITSSLLALALLSPPAALQDGKAKKLPEPLKILEEALREAAKIPVEKDQE